MIDDVMKIKISDRRTSGQSVSSLCSDLSNKSLNLSIGCTGEVLECCTTELSSGHASYICVSELIQILKFTYLAYLVLFSAAHGSYLVVIC